MTDWTHHGVTLLLGDVLDRLADVPDESVDCVITSPPYWGLRDYGVDGQIGLERHLEEHIDLVVQVFREIRRVLKPTGTCFVNYGDCYATSPNGRSAADTKAAGNDDRTFRDKPFSTVGPVCADGSPSTKTRGGNSANKNSAQPSSKRIMAGGYMKPKDLCMVPNRFAIAMQDDGWWVRSEIIWAKPNPMPESIKDRPSTSHEKIFLFTKAPKYHWDADAVLQPVSKSTNARLSQDVMNQIGSERANGGKKTNGNMKAVARKHKNLDRPRPHTFHKARVKDNESFNSALSLPVSGRNLRNYEPSRLEVWVIATASFKEAHFATFPPELVERCIKAGCPEGGHVLDPFGGSGTTGLVSMAMGRTCTLIELNPEYAELAKIRITEAWMGSVEKTSSKARVVPATPPPPLFEWGDMPDMEMSGDD